MATDENDLKFVLKGHNTYDTMGGAKVAKDILKEHKDGLMNPKSGK